MLYYNALDSILSNKVMQYLPEKKSLIPPDEVAVKPGKPLIWPMLLFRV